MAAHQAENPCPWDSPGKNTGVGCHFLLQCRKVKSESEVTQSCPTLSDPMACSPPGSSIHGIFQARVLEWGAIAFSKSPSSHSYVFSSSHVWMWELDYTESWAPKNWCFLTVVLDKTLESPLDFKEIQPINPKGNQSWTFVGRTNAEAPILWPPDAKNWLIWKDPDAGTDWRQEEKGTTEDEMVGWHHRLNGHKFKQALGVGDGQGSLACCSPWGHKESDTTEWLN